MRRTAPARVWWLAALGACTPLGLWVYDDPSFEVARVGLEAVPRTDSAVTVAIDVRNPNDYEVSTARFDLRLALDGRTVGHFARDSIIPVPKFGTATVSLAFTPAAGTTRERLRAFRRGISHFVVEGRAVLTTPFGEREIPVAQGGDAGAGPAE